MSLTGTHRVPRHLIPDIHEKFYNRTMDIEKVLEITEETHQRLKFSLPERIRPFYDSAEIDNLRALLVYGQRGGG